ncbi:MAG: hypothetical protein FIB06_04700 [Betaproteobacteria bacterium]|nr:hypothetical protein [Betaproteobacteria bacterium]
MSPLRHLFLVATLVFAQLAAGAHAVEHAAGDGDGLPAYACQLCLASHDLGAALPSLAALPPAVVAVLPAAAHIPTGRPSPAPPSACQRGPPLS